MGGIGTPESSKSLHTVIFAVGLFLGWAVVVSAGSYDVSGIVRFADGRPAAGARVELTTSSGTRFSTTTGALGSFGLRVDESASSGEAFLQATAEGCQSPVISLPEESEMQVDILLDCDR